MGTLPCLRSLFFSLCILLAFRFSNSAVLDVASAIVDGTTECLDCTEKNLKANSAFEGLRVAIKCKLTDEKYETKATGELDVSGSFSVKLPSELLQEGGGLKHDCFAQLHGASNKPCPDKNGLNPSKIVLKSEEDGKRYKYVAEAGKLSFSSATCVSAFFWSNYPPHHKWGPFHKYFSWHKSFPKFPLPHYSFPPKPYFPPAPTYKPPVVQPPPVPVYKPPVVLPPPVPKYKPPVPIYKPPVVLPPPVPKYKPAPVPVYKPPKVKKASPPSVPVYKKPLPPPVPVYKKPLPPLVPYYKPPIIPKFPPIYKKPLPPIPKFKLPPIYKKPLPPFPHLPPKYKFPPVHSWPPLPPYSPHPFKKYFGPKHPIFPPAKLQP